MADSEEPQVSSTSLLDQEPEFPEADPRSDLLQAKPDLFRADDIVDLVGGAQDALERHIAEDSAPHEVPDPPEPLDLNLDLIRVPVQKPEVAGSDPDSSSAGFAAPCAAPKAEAESSQISAEPQSAPARQTDALPPAQPRTAAAAQQPAGPPPPTSCLFQCCKMKIDDRVVDLLYWRDVKTTGVVFGASLLLLLSLTVCSIVSVCSYIGLALLSVTICFRIYKGILQAIQKSDEGHPFKQYLDQDVALSEDMVHKYSDKVLEKLNKTISELRHLFLVEDLVDSIKFAVLMWILTYVGALFNGLTLLILGLIGAFSCPIIYEKHQAQIDHYLNLVNNQIKDIVGKIQAKVPGMKRKTE